MDIISGLKKGERGAIAKAITSVENSTKGSRQIIKAVFAGSGDSLILGMTGPAGAGKSSLIDKMAAHLRKAGLNPAVIAIDPTSHITGGAILGDRLRMSKSTDSGMYIRSIASRGAAGAIASSARNIARILEYAGFDLIIIESVGAGQTEVAISNIADITAVVFSPHTGDGIQAVKAGLTEIGDIYIVNKSDLSGAARLLGVLREFIGADDGPPILRTSAKRGTGISELARVIKEMAVPAREKKASLEAGRLESELKEAIMMQIAQNIDHALDSNPTYSSNLKKVISRKTDPYEAARRIARGLLK